MKRLTLTDAEGVLEEGFRVERDGAREVLPGASEGAAAREGKGFHAASGGVERQKVPIAVVGDQVAWLQQVG